MQKVGDGHARVQFAWEGGFNTAHSTKDNVCVSSIRVTRSTWRGVARARRWCAVVELAALLDELATGYWCCYLRRMGGDGRASCRRTERNREWQDIFENFQIRTAWSFFPKIGHF